MEREKLQTLLIGKVIERAELNRGSMILHFKDGTRFVREKTFEGLTEAALFGQGGETIASTVLS